MYILKVKAFADFDIPYDINISVFGDLSTVEYLRDTLNKYISECSVVDQDILFSKLMENKEEADKFCGRVRFAFTGMLDYEALNSFVDTIFSICKNNCVYINTNIFSIEEVKFVI